MIPPEYLNHRKVFSEEESHRLPKYQPWDHSIDLKPDAPETLKSKVYPMPLNEQEELDRFITENLKKGYIVLSKSPMASPVFFVKKKNGKLRAVQDYRYLNKGTIKNSYPLPLISTLFENLRSAKWFTTLDIRWGYNNIRCKDGLSPGFPAAPERDVYDHSALPVFPRRFRTFRTRFPKVPAEGKLRQVCRSFVSLIHMFPCCFLVRIWLLDSDSCS